MTDDPNSNLDVTEKMLKDYTTENYEDAEEIANGFTYYLKLAQEQAGDLIVHYINHHELDGKGFNEMMKSIKIADILCKKCGKLYDNSNTLDLPNDIAEPKGLLNIKKDLEREYEAHLKAEKILNKHTKNENKK